MTNDLHKKLIEKQTSSELERKQKKAARKNIFTQEDIDLAARKAEELIGAIIWD